jgi:hypothetical protein
MPNDGPITIIIRPTRRIEQLGSIKFRVYEGKTDTGIPLVMLALFRVNDPDKRAEFERAVCAVDVGDPTPARLLTVDGLINP